MIGHVYLLVSFLWRQTPRLSIDMKEIEAFSEKVDSLGILFILLSVAAAQ